MRWFYVPSLRYRMGLVICLGILLLLIVGKGKWDMVVGIVEEEGKENEEKENGSQR